MIQKIKKEISSEGFSSFGLSDTLLYQLSINNFTNPTKIQEDVISIALQNSN
jgi:superfamily II DNA/RNA helicase